MIGFGELTEIRRNAGLIVEACRAIKHGDVWVSADKIDLDAGQNLKFIETRNEGHTLEVLEMILKSLTRFDPVWQTQVLTALNEKSRLSRRALNQHLRGLLNPSAGSAPMTLGDKIICLRNCRVVPMLASSDDSPASEYIAAGEEEFLANGEIGRVLCTDERFAVVRFREDQPGEELTTKIWLPKTRREESKNEDAGTVENFDLAYAITTHKSQGSESPVVIIVVDPAATNVADRNWHYTAISRASKLCLILGQRSVMDRQCARVQLVKRKTFLCEELGIQ